MTITLLLNSEGKKMGKTANGAVWLDPNKTTPYDFYQYWRNVGDDDVLKCLRMLNFLPLEQIDEMAKALFVGGGDMSNVPSTQLTGEDLTDGSIGVLDLMVKCKLAPSKKEARRLVEQGGVEVNGQKVAGVAAAYTAADLSGEGLMIKKGKKVFHKATIG